MVDWNIKISNCWIAKTLIKVKLKEVWKTSCNIYDIVCKSFYKVMRKRKLALQWKWMKDLNRQSIEENTDDY